MDKPINKKPVSDQSQNYEKNFNNTMAVSGVNLTEVDSMLNEKEQSLKKKIFNLAKMESLVFADPKLSTVYDDMSENGEEKYGYHYNETIMNMIFNDYVLNSAKYIQKYKMAIPKQKKRRDKSGINQLKKSGDETMSKDDDKKVDETTGSGSSGAYVGPAVWGSGDIMKTKGKSDAMTKPIWNGGTFIKESEYITDPKAFQKIYDELNENIDREEVNNYIEDETNAFSSDNIKNWSDEDIKTELDTINTGTMDESGYNQDMFSTKEDLIQLIKSTKERTGKGLSKDQIPMLAGEALYTLAIKIANRLLPVSWDDLGDINSMWDYIDENGGMTMKDFMSAVKEACNDRLAEEGFGLDGLYENLPEKIVEHHLTNKEDKINFIIKAEEILSGDMDGEASNVVTKTLKFLPEFAVNALYAEYEINLQQKGVDPKTIGGSSEEASGIEETDDSFGDIVADKVAEKMLGEATELDNKSEDLIVRVWQAAIGGELPSLGEMKQDIIGLMSRDNITFEEMCETLDNNNMLETEASMLDNPQMSMSNTAEPLGVNTTMPTGMEQMSEDLDFEELNEELEAYSIYLDKMKKIDEDRKPSSLVLKDRLGKENETNFKKDFAKSDTKDTINVEKELMYDDEQTDVGKDPQKFSKNIEKEVLKKTKGEALENVGDSTNFDGDEIPKRNATDDEQHDVDMVRLNLGDYIYDAKPSERFEERMEQDMGEDLYKKRQEKMEFRSKAPMYNKDTQPIEDGDDKEQFNKEKKGWSNGINESMITGRYINGLNKSVILDFKLPEVFEIKESLDYFKLDLTGLGNSLIGRSKGSKVLVNEGVVKIIEDFDFYTDGNKVYGIKKSKDINEAVETKKADALNEGMSRIKQLSGYKPQNFVSTKTVKKNRGF